MYILLSPAEIAENIQKRAKAQNIAVHTLLQSQHIGVSLISKMRLQGRYPRFDTLFKIASGLGCTVDDLCTYSIAETETEHRYSVQQHHDK